jgi:hypothetical protein
LVIIVANCEKCGLQLPDGAEYCPNCGSPVRKRREVPIPTAAAAVKLLEAGLLGAFLAVLIESFVGIDLYFLPSFAGALVAIFVFRARRLEEALLIAFAVYFFTDGIITAINWSSLYLNNMSYVQLASSYPELSSPPTLLDVLIYSIDPIAAIVAAYIGYKLTSRTYVEDATIHPHERREEQGGIVYSVEGEERKPSAQILHKV